MAAPTTEFYCTDCGYSQRKWFGQCPECKHWNTAEERSAAAAVAPTASGKAPSARSAAAASGNKPRSVRDISKQTYERTPTGIGELDRVLGGGLVPGGVILLAGSPGSGKSTLSNSMAFALAEKGKRVLIVSGEETESQIASRIQRLGAEHDNVYLMAESSLPNALEQIQDLTPDFFVVDSLQTLVSGDSESRVGSPSQVADVAHGITNLAKRMNVPCLVIGHITKEGSIAGPRQVEHLVDVVLYFEANEDSPLRILRGIKNRFGSLEVGVFEHTADGFEEVADPSGFFLVDHEQGVTGYATSIVIEGNRALPIEIQALVAPTKLPNPRKISNGLDNSRVQMIQAILEKHAGLRLNDKDVYVSTTGGLLVKDSSVDLAIAAAIMSSAKNIAVPSHSVFLGETTLTGEVRPARGAKKRAAEARRLGFNKLVEPHSNKDLDVTANNVGSIRELRQLLAPTE